MPTTPAINPVTTTATDAEGNTLAPTGNTIESRTTPEGQVVFSLPVTLSEGAQLQSFTDTETGITFADNTLTIPVKDEAGNTTMEVVAKVEAATGTGTTAEAVVTSMSLRTTKQSQDFSAEDPDVGTVGASVQAELKTLPEDSSLRVTVSKEPDPDAQTSFRLAASSADLSVVDVAFAIDVQRTNLENVTDLGSATITMSVSEAWVQEHGAENVKVFRVTETGTEILEPTRVTCEGGICTFDAISPQGLSVFGLVAVAAAPPPGGCRCPSAEAALSVSLGEVLIGWSALGLLIGGGYYVVRRRREN